MPRDAAAELLADLGFVALRGPPRAGANNGRPGSGEQTRGTGSSSGCANHGSQTSGTDSSGTDSSGCASNGSQTRDTDSSSASNGSQTGKRKHRWYHSGDAVGNGCGPSQASPICHDPAGRSKTCQGSQTCQAGRR
jgi:hypothetical protein